MITIDGAEGWGQVLRTAVALSALTLKPIRVINIRKQRAKPGLMAQHLTGVKAAAEFCSAEVKGLEIGSMEIEFIPKQHVFEDKKIDIGTAGSITLLLQTLTPILIFSDKKISLQIIGGTDVSFSPTVDYFQSVFVRYLHSIGVEIEIELKKRGFYPRGGGQIEITYYPVKEVKNICLTERGKFIKADILSYASEQLRKNKVAERQLEYCKRILGLNLQFAVAEYVSSLSLGSTLHSHVHYDNCLLGASAVGARAKPAEKVGEEVANELKKSIESKACFDKYMSDQIIPFIALAEGESFISVEDFTQHLKTNVAVTEQILGVKFKIDEAKKIVEVEGVGFKSS